MQDETAIGPPGLFKTTSWSTVLHARDPGVPGAAGALEELLRRYYDPIRRIILSQRRCPPDQADDLTQEFIKECLRRDFLREVGPEKGRFRTFIRRCLQHFLRDEHVRASAAKRGSGSAPLSLDLADDEGHALLDPAGAEADPGQLLDREWARQVVETALGRLERECLAARRAELYRELKSSLTGRDEAATAATAGARLGLAEGAVHVARHRLRQRLGELIRDEVRETVENEAECREELQYLLRLTTG